MKRFTALILTIVIGISTVFGMTGCTAVQEDGALTMGQWLTLVAESFGMQSYTEENPYFEKVPSSDSSFAAFQMAAEWDIVEPSAEIDSSTPLKWNDVLITLVNAGDFVDEDATDQEKIDYAINNIDTSVRDYWGDRYVELSEAVPVLDKAQKLWANRKYEESIEEVKFEEGVKDFTASDDLSFEMEGDIVRTTDSQFSDLREGDIYALPATNTESVTLNRVESIQHDGNEIIITNEDESEFSEDEIMENLQDVQIQSTDTIDFTQITAIYDGNGNLLYSPQENVSNSKSENENYEIVPLGKIQADNDLQEAGFLENINIKFEVEGFEIKLSTKKAGVKLEISKDYETKTNRYRKLTKKIFASAEISDVDVSKKIDIGFGGLKYLRASLDFTTTLEGGVSAEKDQKIGNPIFKNSSESSTLNSVINQYKDAINNITKDIRNSKNKNDYNSIYIARIETTIPGVSIIIKGKVGVDGEIKLSFETNGSKGIEYDGKNIRFINENNNSTDFAADGNAEITIGLGVGISAFKMNLIELMADLGAGIKVGSTINIVDDEMHKLFTISDSELFLGDADEVSENKQTVSSDEILDKAKSEGGTWNNYVPGRQVDIMCGICLDWKVYPILKVGIEKESTVGKIMSGFNKSISKEFLNSESNAILKGHIDFPSDKNFENIFADGVSISDITILLGVNQTCKFEFKPWDELKDEEEKEKAQNQEIKVTSTIQLSSVRLFMDKEQEATVNVVGLPEGYKLEDVTAEVDDESIATYDLDTFTVKTKDKPGTTQIVIQTKDGKHKAYCAVTINEDFSVDFEGLPEM